MVDRRTENQMKTITKNKNQRNEMNSKWDKEDGNRKRNAASYFI